MIYKLAISQARDVHLAEDVTSNVFLKYMESKKVFESEEHIKAWLLRVTINEARSVFSSSWFKKTVPLDETLEAAGIPEEESEVYLAVMRLPEKYRTVIHLFYYEDFSVLEIANILNTKESTVKSQLLRGRNLLKNALEGVCDLV
ncbi:MAG: sigma-70 family RNA polymerase sigma factor [Clostridia bacterium]|nr:sigma-70 family RNA polymerase sigma factor [Clostridia bacterium]